MISDTTNNTSSSGPIAAVRQTIVEILAQHQKEKQTTTRSKSNRGSRLRNHVWLNITEDEHVLLKLKEKKRKKRSKTEILSIKNY